MKQYPLLTTFALCVLTQQLFALGWKDYFNNISKSSIHIPIIGYYLMNATQKKIYHYERMLRKAQELALKIEHKDQARSQIQYATIKFLNEHTEEFKIDNPGDLAEAVSPWNLYLAASEPNIKIDKNKKYHHKTIEAMHITVTAIKNDSILRKDFPQLYKLLDLATEIKQFRESDFYKKHAVASIELIDTKILTYKNALFYLENPNRMTDNIVKNYIENISNAFPMDTSALNQHIKDNIERLEQTKRQIPSLQQSIANYEIIPVFPPKSITK